MNEVLTAGTAVLGAGTEALLCTNMNLTSKKLLAGTTGIGATVRGGMLCRSVMHFRLCAMDSYLCDRLKAELMCIVSSDQYITDGTAS